MMQPVADPPRTAFTSAQVVGLIQSSNDLTISAGAELLDQGLKVIADLSGDLVGGVIERQMYATLHGTCRLDIRTDLDWGRAIVRPFMEIYDGTITCRFNLGAYFTNVPDRDVSTEAPINSVQGYDILHGLASPIGEAYGVNSGTAYLTAVENILISQGYTKYLIDQTSAAKALPTDRVWVFDQQTTWLGVVNDLLASIGYQGIWSDWDGRLRCQPYNPPSQRGPEWTYDMSPTTGMIAPERSISVDYFDAPNRWVFYRNNNVDGVAPVEGAGVYTFINQASGGTSVSARGRTISKVVGVDVADQASLVALAGQTIDADMRLKRTIKIATSPNPLHWHFDVMLLNDSAIGILNVLSTRWTLPLDGGDMAHDWSVIEP